MVKYRERRNSVCQDLDTLCRKGRVSDDCDDDGDDDDNGDDDGNLTLVNLNCHPPCFILHSTLQSQEWHRH